MEAPPGAGKTTLVARAADALAQSSGPCPVIAQTNSQADQLVRRLAYDYPHLRIARLTGVEHTAPEDLRSHTGVRVGTRIESLERTADVIVGTAMKWATVTDRRWPWAIIDEAYQMRSDALLLIGKLFDRALFVGDPGQLDPFSIVRTPRWIGLPHDPMNSAVSVLMNHNDATVHTLPVSWRLPPSAAALVSRAFYPFTPFQPGTAPGTRKLALTIPGLHDPFDATVEEAARTGWALHELPLRHTARIDAEAAQATVSLAARILIRSTEAACETYPDGRKLEPRDIAVGTAHREQARHIQKLLDHNPHTQGVRADTANRLQGREFAVTIVLHPLSGRRDASAFHM